MTSRDNIIRNGIGIDHYTEYKERPRLDWIQVDVPEVVAAYQGPQLVNPAPVVNEEGYPADDALSKENRKLREQLARMRKETGEEQVPGSQQPAVSQPQQVTMPPQRTQPQYNARPPAPVNADMSGNRYTAPSQENIQTPAELNSIQKRLQLLKELHDKGLITDQEYNEKRKEIVEQI